MFGCFSSVLVQSARFTCNLMFFWTFLNHCWNHRSLQSSRDVFITFLHLCPFIFNSQIHYKKSCLCTAACKIKVAKSMQITIMRSHVSQCLVFHHYYYWKKKGLESVSTIKPRHSTKMFFYHSYLCNCCCPLGSLMLSSTLKMISYEETADCLQMLLFWKCFHCCWSSSMISPFSNRAFTMTHLTFFSSNDLKEEKLPCCRNESCRENSCKQDSVIIWKLFKNESMHVNNITSY